MTTTVLHRFNVNRKPLEATALLALLAMAVVALGAAGWLLFEFEKPTVALDRELRFLGGRVELPLHAADNKSGIRALAQGGPGVGRVDPPTEGRRVYPRTHTLTL